SRNGRDTDSGLASVVTSAPGASPNASSTTRSTRASSPAGSSDGVPPPTKTVDTLTVASPSTRRAILSSAIALSAQVAGDDVTDPSAAVSSVAVYVLKSQ